MSSELLSEIEATRVLACTEIVAAATVADVNNVKQKFLGNNGRITSYLKLMGNYSGDKKELGQCINQAKAAVEAALADRIESLESGELEAQFQAERIDVTMPERPIAVGLQHILDQTGSRIKHTLGSLGFEYIEGPELEMFEYNFDALNYPPNHPAMDDQDTFFIDDKHLLRTQCTAIQGRVLQKIAAGELTLPARFFTVGRTYRNEAVDRTHSHTFSQVDCFMIDKGVSMAHLKGTLNAFAREMFGDSATVRFRPDFFPFVEPGVDYAISTPKLFDGKWVELGGAGLIHPNILEAHGIDPDVYSGFAFGLGVERIPMMMYGIEDLRLFFENDLRFLRQFRAQPINLNSGVQL
jgi:phenylalanyl-tRNA synthetase alpha chain